MSRRDNGNPEIFERFFSGPFESELWAVQANGNGLRRLAGMDSSDPAWQPRPRRTQYGAKNRVGKIKFAATEEHVRLTGAKTR